MELWRSRQKERITNIEVMQCVARATNNSDRVSLLLCCRTCRAPATVLQSHFFRSDDLLLTPQKITCWQKKSLRLSEFRGPCSIRKFHNREVSAMFLIVALAGTSLIVACMGLVLPLAAAVKGN